MADFTKEERGQISVEYIVGFMVFIVIFAALMPTIANRTATLEADSNLDTSERALVGLITLLIIVAVVVGIVKRT